MRYPFDHIILRGWYTYSLCGKSNFILNWRICDFSHLHNALSCVKLLTVLFQFTENVFLQSVNFDWKYFILKKKMKLQKIKQKWVFHDFHKTGNNNIYLLFHYMEFNGIYQRVISGHIIVISSTFKAKITNWPFTSPARYYVPKRMLEEVS